MKKPSNRHVWQKFEQYLVTRGFGPNTRTRYSRYVFAWLEHLETRRKTVWSATIDDGSEFWSTMVRRYKPPTLRQVRTVLRTFYRWLQIDYPVRDPFVFVTVDAGTYEPRRRPVVEAEDLVRLFTGWSPTTWSERRDRAMIATLVSTGCRCLELCRMDVDDIDWRRKAIRIHGKGGKPGWGSIQSPVDEIVREWVDTGRALRAVGNERALWLNDWGGRIKGHTVRSALRRVLSRANIDVPLTPHGVRHSNITAVYRHSGDIRAAKEFARHASIATTLIYIADLPDEVLEIAEQHHPIATILKSRQEESLEHAVV